MSDNLGIIHPPPDLRGIVDRTATYVAKNGSAFEARIMHEQKGKPKFSFLFPSDPFNAYYRHKVSEIRSSLLSKSDSSEANGQEHTSQNNGAQVERLQSPSTTQDDDNSSKVKKTEDDDPKNQPQSELSQSCDSIPTANVDSGGTEEEKGKQRPGSKSDKPATEKPIKLEEPPPLNYLASPASTSTHLECDIIKLTSQYIATYGRPFILELVSREQSNSLFDFLKPQHGQFSYMTKLIMQYALILNPPLDIVDNLEKESSNQDYVLERIRMRAEWNRMLENERKKKEEAEERERELYNQIDWHDFVIVETVDYQPGDKGEYPPTTADNVGTRLLKQQRLEDHSIPEEMDIDMDVESDHESDNEQSGGESGFAVPQPPDLNKVTIRKNYDPKAANRSVSSSDNYFISPITNERIPVEKIHEHVRYNLADPRYLEKKEQILQGKINEETVFASGSQIQSSLKNLAERRTDIFGMNDAETAIGQRIGEESEEQKKEDRTIWDGHKSSLKKKKLN